MTIDKFKTQFDGCTLVECGGKAMSGLNCGAAGEAMSLFRSTQGRVDVSSCHVRDLMNDCDGGTNFEQAKAVSDHYGVTVGALWQPGRLSALKTLMLANAYPIQVSIGYAPLVGTANDCFRGQFKGAHRIYVKGASLTTGVRYGDPGANGRYAGCPSGWQSMSWSMFARVTGALPLKDGGPTLQQDYGDGYVFAYIGPKDPVPVAVTKWKVHIEAPDPPRLALKDKPYGTVKASVTKATYICTLSKDKSPYNGLVYSWYRIVSKVDGSHTDNAGLYLTPNKYVEAVRL